MFDVGLYWDGGDGMTENKENWLYCDASGLYFVHDGFIMRATDGKQYDIEKECDLLNELFNKTEQLKKENEQLKNELDSFKSSNNILQKELIKKVEEKAKLKTQNQGLQFKIIDMLDFVKDKGTVTREEIKEWWNNSQRGDNL